MRVLKSLILASIMTVVFAMPAMAQEVTDPNTVIKEEVLVNELTAHHATVEKQLDYFKSTQVIPAVCDAHVATVRTQLKNYERGRADNYLKYLDYVIYNLNETVRIKKEIVTNYTWLSQYNPQFATMIPAAQADVDKAELWVTVYKNYKSAVAQDFDTRYPR